MTRIYSSSYFNVNDLLYKNKDFPDGAEGRSCWQGTQRKVLARASNIPDGQTVRPLFAIEPSIEFPVSLPELILD